MRKPLVISSVLVSLSLAAPAYTAGEIPTVDVPPGSQSCTATSTELVFQGPATGTATGKVFEEGVGTIASFTVGAGQTKKISVPHGGALCTSTNLPNRKFRVAPSSAPPFQIEVKAEAITLAASGPASDPVAGITTASLTLACANGAVSGDAEIKTGTGVPNPLFVTHTADSATGKTFHKGPLDNKTFSVPIKLKPITGACTSAHTFAVGIESPASSKTLAPSEVRLKKVP